MNRIVRKSEDLVLYVPAPARRIMFFVLFLMLAASMAAGFDADVDLSGSRAVKTIGFCVVLLILLGAAGWSRVTCFDLKSGNVESISRLLGFTVRRKMLAHVEQIEGVVLQKAALLRTAPPGGRLGVFGNLFEPRSELLRLFLTTGDGRIDLDEGGGPGELERTAAFIAEFLGVRFTREELT